MKKQLVDEWIKKLSVPKNADVQITYASLQITIYDRKCFKLFIEKFEALTEEYDFRSCENESQFRIMSVIDKETNNEFELVIIYDYSDNPDFSINDILFDGLTA